MNRQYRTIIVMAVAVATAALASLGVYTALQRMPVRTVEVGTVNVVVAAEPLNVGTQLQREQLKVIAWPAKNQVPGAFADPNDVIDRGVIETINVNEPVTSRKVASKELGAGLSPVIPQGMRALSIRVNDVISVAGYVVPGTRVDVLVTVRAQAATANEPMSRTVVSNLQVLTAGTRIEQGQDQSKPVQVTVVTLLVYPDQAERLALASTEGKIQLALRNPLDQGAPPTPGIKTAGLLGSGAGKPAQQYASASRPRSAQPVTNTVPAAAPLPTVEIIRGDKRAQEVVR